MEYLFAKWLHVVSSTVLFGAGIGSAFHLFAASLGRKVPNIATATRTVVIADWLLTTPAAIFQPLSGLWLVHIMGLPLATPWVAWSLVLYVIAIACWLPVVWIQLRLRDHAATALASGGELHENYWWLFRGWVVLGFVAFFAFLAIFWLMVAKRTPFE